MPHLTRIRINPQRRQARQLLGNPAAMKAAVYAGVPTQPVHERVLWRLDTDNPHQPLVYVVTETQPSYEHLIEQAGWPNADTPQVEVANYTPMLARIAAGDRYAFRLTANPTYTVTITDDQGIRRKIRAAHKTPPHQTRWLLDRADQHGIVISTASAIGPDGTHEPDVLVAGRDRRQFHRSGSGRVTIDQVTYDGHLTVSDPYRLRDSLTRGIGRAKGYGCGLLTLAPFATSSRQVA